MHTGPISTTQGGAFFTHILHTAHTVMSDDRTVRIQYNIVRLSSAPQIVDGKLSSTGKTILVEIPNGSDTKAYRLNADEILSGETIYRDSQFFELYTPARFRSEQKSNHNPGPVRGADEVTGTEDLPEPTHTL